MIKIIYIKVIKRENLCIIKTYNNINIKINDKLIEICVFHKPILPKLDKSKGDLIYVE